MDIFGNRWEDNDSVYHKLYVNSLMYIHLYRERRNLVSRIPERQDIKKR